MSPRRLAQLALAPLLALAITACGGEASTARPATTAGAPSTDTPSLTRSDASHNDTASRLRESTITLRDWLEFGGNPQRSDASDRATGITAVNVSQLRRIRVSLPGTVDSSPIYLHSVRVAGAIRDVIVLTTTYGKSLAVDASDGRILWTFTPPGYASWAGSAQITTASPLADPDRQFIYTASPNGLIHKLALADGREARIGSWPVSVTRDPKHEKLAAALNIDGPDVVVSTGGYIGDIPPYQGHVVLIARSSGAVRAVFNTLCANRRELIQPSSCPASDSAILSRGGAVVEPGGAILLDTGNAPWNGTTNFGDSVLELSFPALRLLQAYTPTNQAQLNSTDTDLGSSAPALLGSNRVVLAGKDGILRLLARSSLDGHPPSNPPHEVLGGELQTISIPGGGQLFTAPAVWHHGGHTTMFVADAGGTASYALSGGRLRVLWENATAGTSPVLAGGLLYVYDPARGGINVYRPGTSRPIAKLAGTPGHWNSPIVVDGHVVEPEGNANDHSQSGTLDLFSIA
jgi:hypothetical protein